MFPRMRSDAFAPPPSLPPLHACLREIAPTWAYGCEEPRTQAGFLRLFAHLAGSRPEFAPARAVLAAWSWQTRPVDPQFAPLFARALAEEAAQGASQRIIGKETADVAAACASLATAHLPENVAAPLSALLAAPEPGLLVHLLLPLMPRPGVGAVALCRAWDTLVRMGVPELAGELLAACALPPEARGLRERLRAELAFHFEPGPKALAALAVLPEPWGGWAAQRRAELLALAGEEDAARAVYAKLFAAMPWHANLALRLHALSHPATPEPGLTGRIPAAVCLYSWNKRELLAATLDSLAASDLGRARVAVLDNGSTDGTWEMLEAQRGRFGADGAGEDRLLTVRLPVNVGAPAARNWLLSLPEVASAEWAVFLDDDVLLPPDWLAKLLCAGEAARAGGGRVGAVGCRITEPRPPYGLQSADYHLFPPPPPDPDRPADEPRERIGIFDNCAGQADNGLFTYARPCCSVSGCCHAIHREALEAAGAFDVRFTPTQFDDLERDMRSTLKGFPSFYEGRLAVRHVQHSSLARARTPAQIGHIAGNRVKLEGKYTDEEVARLAQADLALAWDHFGRVLADLGQREGA
ncbi:glycosyl transferase family 2 [Desulfovibrio sp. X2]|uniref:glycosyltransferase n=1 Tax=Desulfovibrio sp. X2 TaxID=941449 RepID=UPI000358AC00|nr:glycosyltransferase [Desulfovibrio sp. X2]EPR39992.1 glycosyl transferase family 2 [Desulfovibrio sp. X2]